MLFINNRTRDFSKPPRQPWATGEDLIRSFEYRTGMQGDKVTILKAVWEKELGHLAKHWSLTALRKGILYVKPSSSAAAQELYMRAPEIARSLNKYFNRPWIKSVKTSIK